jgi:hypothetical protein
MKERCVVSARWAITATDKYVIKYIRICAICTNLLAFRVRRSCRRWAAVFPLATILTSGVGRSTTSNQSRIASAAMHTHTTRGRNITKKRKKTHVTNSSLQRRHNWRKSYRENVRERETYLALRDSQSQRFGQSLRQSCGIRQGRRRYARDRDDRARRGGTTQIRRSRENACPSPQRRRRQRRLRVVVGPG